MNSVSIYLGRVFIAAAIAGLLTVSNAFGGQCSIRGKVGDSSTKEGLASATVSIHNAADSSLLKGSLTDIKGNFTIEGIADGNYYLKVSYIGYSETIVPSVKVEKGKNYLEVGPIYLQQSVTTTQEVNVSGERPDIQFNMGKTVINIDKNLAASGGTALDALKLSPAVEVTPEGSIKLRGSANVRILIDGKPSPSLGDDPSAVLKQISASSLQSIEIITNPSAKYEAEGQSGIINLVLAKNKTTGEGLNGLYTANAGSRDRYSASVNMNYKRNFYNFFANYDFQREINPMKQVIDRSSFLGDSMSQLILSSSSRHDFFVHSVKGGAELDLGKGHSLAFYGIYKNVGQTVSNNNIYDTYNPSGSLSAKNGRNFFIDQPNIGSDIVFNYKKQFEKKGMEWTVDAYYSCWSLDGASNFSWSTLNQDGSPIGSLQLQKLSSVMKLDFYTVQSDFVLPFEGGGKLELGYKSDFKNMDLNAQYYNQDNSGKEWVLDGYYSCRYKSDEQIHALYSVYSGSAGSFDYQAGLRFEYTHHLSDVLSLGEEFSDNYADFFPSAVVSYKFTDYDQAQLSYSRRITRPYFTIYPPVRKPTDPMNVLIGNPEIKPTYTDSYELSFIKNIDNHLFTPTVFYRRNTDNIFMFGQVDLNGVLNLTFNNCSDGENYGLDFSYQGRLFKELGINFSMSYYRQVVDVRLPDTSYSNSDYTWSGRLSTNINILPNLLVQVFCLYQPDVVTSIGRRLGFYYVDLSARWDVYRDLSLTFRLSDVFETIKYGGMAKGSNYTFENKYYPESRNIYIGFTYKLNNYSKPKDRREKDDTTQGDGLI